MKNWMWLLLAALLLGVDQASKLWALHALAPYQPLSLFPGVDLTLAFNSGSAFGFLSQSGSWHQLFFTCFSLVMSAGLVVWIAMTNPCAKLQLFALSLVLSGALGNVIDRLRLGYVIDFIDVYVKTHHWPVFNIADSAICIGAFLLFCSTKDK